MSVQKKRFGLQWFVLLFESVLKGFLIGTAAAVVFIVGYFFSIREKDLNKYY